MKNIILTGIPRSGTTLAAALLDGLPDTVCLNEPDWQAGRRMASGGDYARWLVGDFMELRKKFLAGEPVRDRRRQNGAALTNYFSAGAGGMKTHYEMVGLTRAGLSPDFTLAVKHNGPYLAILKPILDIGWFRVIAIVRNPIEVIASWRALDLPISRAEMPAAAPYWPRLAEIIQSGDELLIKQAKIYDLMCRRIHNLRDRMKVILYEDMVRNPALLSDAAGVSSAPSSALIEKPPRIISDTEREVIALALRAHGEFYRHFYPEI